MFLENLIFYVLSFFIIISALAVVTARNPVYSVLLLIFTFLNTAGIFIILGAEFLAFVLVIVYVGAVAVLFLFVVMLVSFRQVKTKVAHAKKYFVLSATLVLILGAELLFFLQKGYTGLKVPENRNDISSLADLGIVLFNNNYYIFIVSSLILTVAMIGTVLLSSVDDVHKADIKQNTALQNKRSKEASVKTVKIEPESGIK